MSKTLSRFVEPIGLAKWEGLIHSLRSFTPAGRASRVQIGYADLSNPVVYFEGSNA
jgi:hypothetical protein